MSLRLSFLAACCTLFGTVSVWGQTTLAEWNARGQLRDACVDTSSGRVYAAAYDRDQVWVFDPASGERLAQIPVGNGPSALALEAGGRTLACLNRLDGTVSLVRLPQEEVDGVVQVGEGATVLEALPLGGFIVANPFEDALTAIDPSGQGSAATWAANVPVPSALAVGDTLLAVASRAGGGLFVYDLATRGQVQSVPMDDVRFLRALPAGRFLAGSSQGLQVADGASGKIVAKKNMDAVDAAVDGGTIVVLSGTSVVRLNGDLAAEDTVSLNAEALRIQARNGFVLALNPRDQVYQAYNPNGLALHAPPVSAPVVAEATPTVVEAAPAGTPAPAPASQPVAAAQPAAPEAQPAPAPAQQAPAAVEAPPAQSGKDVVHRYPLRTSGIGAPEPGRRPSANPLNAGSPRTITDALLQPTEFGSPGSGFVAPDWTQPMEDVQAGHGTVDLDTGRHLYEDKVHLRLGNMLFQSDLLSYSESDSEFFAQGNVRVEQESSYMTADDILYEAPLEEELPPPQVLEDPLDEQGQARQRLSLGRVHANGVHIVEPTREVSMDTVTYDFLKSEGELYNAHGRAGVFYYNAKHLRVLGPASVEGEDVWVTTCDHDPPHYKLRVSKVLIEDGELTRGSNTRLQLGKVNTPLYLPSWRRKGTGFNPWAVDFDSGRRAEIGYYLNLGQRFDLSPYVSAGPRIFPTEKEGVGIGGDVEYDFSKNPASWFYRTKGEIHGLVTTEDRDYLEWYHRYEYSDDLVLRVQAEQWGDETFYKEFFYDEYRNRTTPRTFANVTYRQPGYIATGTVRLHTHSWVRETERLPEATFHLLERPLGSRLYLTFDTINGYNDRQPRGSHGTRTVNIARLTYDWDPLPALSITPFLEGEASWYSRERVEDSSAGRGSITAGTTFQSRFHRDYEGFWGFSAFKHIVVPSVTYSYRPETSLDIQDTPAFDTLDSVFGRSRIETKLANVFYGRDAETGEVWQVGRLTLYQGNDFWNETRKAEDYEVEVDIRPRSWWGLQMAGERHKVSKSYDTDSSVDWEERFRNWYEDTFGGPVDWEPRDDYTGRYGDYDRVLAQLYYDDTLTGGNIQSRIGFAYTGTDGRKFNREVLYGFGYRWEKWGLGFEHRYDLEADRLRTQTYELRRSLHCWETALRFRDRESGFDIDIAFNIKAFPGSQIKF